MRLPAWYAHNRLRKAGIAGFGTAREEKGASRGFPQDFSPVSGTIPNGNWVYPGRKKLLEESYFVLQHPHYPYNPRMQRLARADIPAGYHYYRSHSEAYFSSVVEWKDDRGFSTVREEGFYGFVRHFCFRLFSIAYFEKCDHVPEPASLRKYGFRRGLAFWSGWRRESPGPGWYRLPDYLAWAYHHSTRSAFSVLGPEYWKKWSPGPRGHRKAIRKSLESGDIRIDTEAPIEDFLAIYGKTKLPHGWKNFLVHRHERLFAERRGNLRTYLASANGKILAGAVFLDDGPTSTYLMAFQDASAKPLHLGLAIIDRWFEESLVRGFEFLDFDHMHDRYDPDSYLGYTQFKSGLADYDVRFGGLWMRWWW